MIVGFPTETRQEFEDTLSLIETVAFDGVFAFAYSDRPNAPAAHFSGAVGETEKMERLNTLLALQERITEKKNQALVGTVQSVLVEGESRKKRHADPVAGDDVGTGARQMTGRTETGKIVHFSTDTLMPGEMVNIKIVHAYPHSLWGTCTGE